MDDERMQSLLDNMDNLAFDFVETLDVRDPESPREFPVYDESIECDLECPMCHYRWSGQPKLAFEKGLDDALQA